MGEFFLSTLNVRGINPEIAELIRKDKAEHGHKNVTQAVECIVVEWAQLRSLKGFDTEKARKLKEMIQKLEDLIQELSVD